MADPDAELAEQVAGARPELDPVAREVIRARATAALFGHRAAIRVGRYDLVRAIGIGGGGSVYAARDPELDREVAVKLIPTSTPALRARALAEGKALAKLAHPNVVAVFDVGERDDRVFLVMELVQGRSLREYAREARSLRTVVAACRQAGEGLAAAHAAGLIHRDFKPDNVVIGTDGRARVIDFGLATATGQDAPARRAGTPAYMAPEQQRGEQITPAGDQFAFGVTLREAVSAVVPVVPRWIAAIVARATAPTPGDRYPAMPALLRALANDPAARWRRRATIAVPAALVSIGLAGFALGRDRAGPTCDATATLAEVWSPDRAAAIERRLVALATPFAQREAARVRGVLDDYAQRWLAGYERVCAQPAEPLRARRIGCFVRARARLDASLELLERVEAVGVPAAARALAELPALARCDDVDSLAETGEPPPARAAPLADALERARVSIEAASPGAAAAIAAITAQARAVDYPPLLADALLVQGRIAIGLDDPAAALAPLAEATRLATTAGADAIAVEAFARATWARLMTGTAPAEARAGFEVVEGLADRLGPRDRFARALLYNNLGVVENAGGEQAAARAHLRTALALAEQVTGPGELELANVRPNLARVTADPAERARLHAAAIAIVESRLGGDHPLALDMRIHAAFDDDDPQRALAALRAAVGRYIALHPTFRATIAAAARELAWLELAYGSREAARAIAAHTDDAALVQLLAGDAAGALAAFEATATATRPAADDWLALVLAGETQLGILLAARDLRDPRAAAARTRAIDYLARGTAIQRFAPAQRRLAWLRTLTE